MRAPDRFIPGSPAPIAVSYANTTGASASVHVAVDVLTEWGVLAEHLEPQTITVPGHG